MKGKKSQMAMVILLLFVVALIFYAVMFPELVSIIDTAKENITDDTLILIYDILPFGIGFMLIIAVIVSIASIVNR